MGRKCVMNLLASPRINKTVKKLMIDHGEVNINQKDKSKKNQLPRGGASLSRVWSWLQEDHQRRDSRKKKEREIQKKEKV